MTRRPDGVRLRFGDPYPDRDDRFDVQDLNLSHAVARHLARLIQAAAGSGEDEDEPVATPPPDPFAWDAMAFARREAEQVRGWALRRAMARLSEIGAEDRLDSISGDLSSQGLTIEQQLELFGTALPFASDVIARWFAWASAKGQNPADPPPPKPGVG